MTTACSPGPAPANTWTVWLGAVPPQLTTFAVDSLKTEAEHPYGYTWTYHGGKLITGICIPGITLYKLKKVGVTELERDLNKPNPDVAWFDEGEQSIDWTLVAGCGAAALGVILLFVLGFRFLKRLKQND
jgi:hypothetical protein